MIRRSSAASGSQRLHQAVSTVWVERCRSQIAEALAVLAEDRAGRHSTYWFGEGIGHADIAVAVVLRFTNEAHAGLVDMAAVPAVSARAARWKLCRCYGPSTSRSCRRPDDPPS
jgi:glutathione S-transferase